MPRKKRSAAKEKRSEGRFLFWHLAILFFEVVLALLIFLMAGNLMESAFGTTALMFAFIVLSIIGVAWLFEKIG